MAHVQQVPQVFVYGIQSLPPPDAEEVQPLFSKGRRDVAISSLAVLPLSVHRLEEPEGGLGRSRTCLGLRVLACAFGLRVLGDKFSGATSVSLDA